MQQNILDGEEEESMLVSYSISAVWGVLVLLVSVSDGALKQDLVIETVEVIILILKI